MVTAGLTGLCPDPCCVNMVMSHQDRDPTQRFPELKWMLATLPPAPTTHLKTLQVIGVQDLPMQETILFIIYLELISESLEKKPLSALFPSQQKFPSIQISVNTSL